MSRYLDRATRLAADSVASDSFIAELQGQLHRTEGVPAAHVLADVTNWAATNGPDWRRPRDWPKNARATTTRLTRHAPALRSLGWSIEHDNGRNHDNVTKWTITPPEKDAGVALPRLPRNRRSAG
ncbi:hypothetical protein ACNQR7_03525 [Mycolicibacterium senegalense]|uniref:hypothetical protein n=1 Tax=Mycolicibacterium TaxID=1866885 RepID=UPI003204A5F7